jgi:hypothetical protein
LPQLQALPLFIGQFLPLVLHAGWSAANAVAQITAAKIEKTILTYFFITNRIWCDAHSFASENIEVRPNQRAANTR